MAIEIRDVSALEDLRDVIEVEKRVWGYPDAEEAIPLPMLAAGVRRGAIVLAAFDGRSMVGACYSFPALKGGRLAHWSHMLGVMEGYRDRGIGRLLKLEQRNRALAMGIDLIEWTFDPLQAANAHFNLARLGAVVEEYEINIYGESSSPLWSGSDSDRFIAQWNICEPHVERRLARSGPVIRASDTIAAARVLEAQPAIEGLQPGKPDLEQEGRRLSVDIPAHFAPIQRERPNAARLWRSATREVFTTYLGRGYRVLDFWFDRRRGCGTYLLARPEMAERREAA